MMLESLVPKLMQIKGWNATKLMLETELSWGVVFPISKGGVPKSTYVLDKLCAAFDCQPSDIILYKGE